MEINAKLGGFALETPSDPDWNYRLLVSAADGKRLTAELPKRLKTDAVRGTGAAIEFEVAGLGVEPRALEVLIQRRMQGAGTNWDYFERGETVTLSLDAIIPEAESLIGALVTRGLARADAEAALIDYAGALASAGDARRAEQLAAEQAREAREAKRRRIVAENKTPISGDE